MSVYLVLSYQVFDQKRFAQYRAAAALLVPQFNGKILASQANPEQPQSADSISHMSLVRFDTIEDMKEMAHNAMTGSVMALRISSAETRTHVLYGDGEMPANLA